MRYKGGGQGPTGCNVSARCVSISQLLRVNDFLTRPPATVQMLLTACRTTDCCLAAWPKARVQVACIAVAHTESACVVITHYVHSPR
jgi:hypothetical protein